MALCIALIICGLIALCASAVRIDARADIGRESTLRATVTLLFLRLTYDGVLERKAHGLTLTVRRRGRRTKPGKTVFATLQDAGSILRFLRARPRTFARLRGALHLYSLNLWARIGMQDAAQTSLLCGLCRAAFELLAQRVGGPVQSSVRVLPDYRGAVFLCGVHCIINLRGGNIIVAALLAVAEGWIHRHPAKAGGR